MKRATILLLLTCICTLVLAQNKKYKLFEKSSDLGGFGGIFFQMSDKNYFGYGGEGACLLGNIYIGGFGSGSTLGNVKSSLKDQVFKGDFSEGGILIGAISNRSQRLALTTEIKAAWGELNLSSGLGNNIYEIYNIEVMSFIPSIGVTYSISSFLQVRSSLSYHYTEDISLKGIDKKALNYWSLNLGLYFGSLY